MNPSSNGWIKKYFSLVKKPEKLLSEFDLTLTPEEFIYGQLQPTGLMYGFPTNFIFLNPDETAHWSTEDKFKVLLLEGLMISDYAHTRRFDIEDIEKYLGRFISFYESTEIGIARRSWLNFKGLDVFGKLESILSQRVDIKLSLSHKLWTNYLHNSVVFQDLILYFEYYHGTHPEIIADKRRMVLLDMMKLMAVAAHADGEIANEEAALFDIFMASARLDDLDYREAQLFWNEQKTLNEIAFDYEMSWLLKRYFIEVATLVVWSDKVVVPIEQIFLDNLSEKLKVDEEEQDKSFIAIQSFVLNNSETLPFLSGKSEMEQLMVGATAKWKKILARNRDKLALELSQSKELVQLIAKSTSKELNEEEKVKLKRQFKDLAKTIPAFTLFMLPGGSLIMPLVLKLIPDLVPSAFRSNKVEKKKKA
ncbi:MAG: hypothetical protein HUJ25_04380 [Crocinitomicaceae bacterium]|nr:hypothetical protein [Crocinitomicaceae bacterium]